MAADLNTVFTIALQTQGEERAVKLKQALLDLGISADKAESLAAGLDTELNKIGSSAAAAEGRALSLKTALKTLAGAAIVREFLQVNVSFEAMGKTLELVTGSQAGARAEMEFIRAEATRLGIEVQAAASSYIQLAAAAKGTAMEGQATRDLWSGLVGAMSALGKSSADVEGAVTQLSQGISNGKFELEDLKSIAQRIPGFFKLFADALGVTTETLFEMISAGQIGADQLPALAAALGQISGDTDTANAALGRLKNAWTDAQLALGDTGVLETMTTALKGATIIVAGLWEAITLVGKAFGNLAYSIANLDFSGYQARQQEALDKARANMAKVMETTLGAADASKKAGAAAVESGEQHKAGFTVAKLSAAELAAGYREVIAAIQAKAKAASAEMSLAQANVSLEIEQQRTAYQVAVSKGNISAAVAAKNEITRLEIELSRLVARAAIAEAQAAVEVARAKLQEAEAKKENTAAATAELSAAEANLKVKKVQGQITNEIADRTAALATKQKTLAEVTQDVASASNAAGGAMAGMGGAAAGAVPQIDSLTTSVDGLTEAQKRLNEARDRANAGRTAAMGGKTMEEMFPGWSFLTEEQKKAATERYNFGLRQFAQGLDASDIYEQLKREIQAIADAILRRGGTGWTPLTQIGGDASSTTASAPSGGSATTTGSAARGSGMVINLTVNTLATNANEAARALIPAIQNVMRFGA